MDGALHWFRPGSSTARHYSNGFTTDLTLLGSRYLNAPPAPLLQLDKLTDNVTIVAGKGNLDNELVKVATFAPNYRVVVDREDPQQIKMALNPSSGLFRGTFLHPATGKRTKYSGAIFQKQNLAAGHFLGVDQSGYVMVLPAD